MTAKIRYKRKNSNWAIRAQIGYDRYGLSASTVTKTRNTRQQNHGGGATKDKQQTVAINWRRKKKILTLSQVYARLLAR